MGIFVRIFHKPSLSNNLRTTFSDKRSFKCGQDQGASSSHCISGVIREAFCPNEIRSDPPCQFGLIRYRQKGTQNHHLLQRRLHFIQAALSLSRVSTRYKLVLLAKMNKRHSIIGIAKGFLVLWDKNLLAFDRAGNEVSKHSENPAISMFGAQRNKYRCFFPRFVWFERFKRLLSEQRILIQTLEVHLKIPAGLFIACWAGFLLRPVPQ